MESTELTVRLIILFIPGIIETFIYETLQDKEELSDRGFIINVVLSAFVMYSLTYVIFTLVGGGASFLDALLDSSVKINITEILLASLLAIVFGFLEAPVLKTTARLILKKVEKDRKMRASVWDVMLDDVGDNDGKIRIILNDQNIVYEGSVNRYSPSLSKRREICLKDVNKYELKTGNQLQNNISEIYVQIREDEDVVIELIS